MTIKITFVGKPGWEQFHRVGKEMADAVAEALTGQMQLAFRDSQRRVPVKTGVLRASGRLTPLVRTGDHMEISITYGGAASAYAKIIHDDRSLAHPNGGTAGYAVDPVRERSDLIERAIKEAMRRATK